MTRFPDRMGVLSRHRSIYDVWFTLLHDLEATYQSDVSQDNLKDRVWDFAAWCFSTARHESVRNAVAVSFYEHLPAFGPARREMPSRLDVSVLKELLPSFRRTLSDSEFASFVGEFLGAQGASPRDVRSFLREHAT